MDKNEKIFINSYCCRTEQDSFTDGLLCDGGSSGWSITDLPVKQGPYDTADDAIRAICSANGFDYNPGAWINFGTDCSGDPEDYSRFDGDLLVTEDNSQATPDDIELWKKNKKKLWNCHIVILLEIRTVRGFTKEEAEKIHQSFIDRARD